MIRAGSLRHVATVRAKSGTGFAGEVGDWADFTTIRCAIKPVRGSESIENAKDTGMVQYKIFSRWADGVTAGMQVVVQGKNMSIVAVMNPDGIGRDMEIIAESRT